MATITSDGKAVSSGKGLDGMNRATRRLAFWTFTILPMNAAKIKAARKGGR